MWYRQYLPIGKRRNRRSHHQQRFNRWVVNSKIQNPLRMLGVSGQPESLARKNEEDRNYAEQQLAWLKLKKYFADSNISVGSIVCVIMRKDNYIKCRKVSDYVPRSITDLSNQFKYNTYNSKIDSACNSFKRLWSCSQYFPASTATVIPHYWWMPFIASNENIPGYSWAWWEILGRSKLH